MLPWSKIDPAVAAEPCPNPVVDAARKKFAATDPARPNEGTFSVNGRVEGVQDPNLARFQALKRELAAQRKELAAQRRLLEEILKALRED